MELLEAIKGRRSIRKYDADRNVPGEVLDALLDAARWAPSWANVQPVRFIIVRDAGRRKALASCLSAGNPATKAVETAPITVVFAAALGKSGCYKGKPCDDKAWHLFDAGLAMQNFCLAAHAFGLGAVICGNMDYRKIAGQLGVPDGFQVVAMTPLGYPAQEAKAPPRREIADLKSDEIWSPRLEK